MNHFGKKLREIMELEDIRPSKIEEIGGISKQKIGSYIKMEDFNIPNYDSIFEIAKFFNISPEYFFSNLTPSRYRQMEKSKKLSVQIAVLDDSEIDFLHRFISAYASKKIALQNESIELISSMP